MEHQAAIDTHAVERYLLGEMPVDERDAFEEHYFACVSCAEEVRVGAQFRANYDHAGPAKPAAARQRWWEGWMRWPSLIPVAASLAFAGVVWFQASRTAVLATLEDYTIPETVRSGNTVVVPKGTGPAAISFVIPADAPPPPYECTIADSTGKTVGTTTLKRPMTPEARVQLQRDRLSPGLYTVTLRSDGAPVAQYTFQLR
jgi:hypothetical protein